MSKESKTNKEDILYAVIKGAWGAVPGLGSFAAEFMGLILTSPLEERRTKYLEDLAARLKKLEDEERLTVEGLQSNDQFIDTILTVNSLALKTSELEKIEAFKNAVINTALGIAPDRAMIQIFLQAIDRFTVVHINFLVFISDPRKWFDNRNLPYSKSIKSGNSNGVIDDAFPELVRQVALKNHIWKDLKDMAFFDTHGFGTLMPGVDQVAFRDIILTALGKNFLDFISSHE